MNRRSLLKCLPAAIVAALMPRTRSVAAAGAVYPVSGMPEPYNKIEIPVTVYPNYRIGWTSISSNTATTLTFTGDGWECNAYTGGVVSFASPDDWHPALEWDDAP